MKVVALSILIFCFTLMSCADIQPATPTLRVLIVDGQNNHGVWPKTTAMMKNILQDSGQFEVDVYRTLNTWKLGEYAQQYGLKDGKSYVDLSEPKTDEQFSPNFFQYDVVISNFGWKAANWPISTQQAFEQYMKNGGGFVSVHAADNSFPAWTEYNKMIGLGGWGGRNERSGPYVYFNKQNHEVRDHKAGHAGAHGKQHAFDIQVRDASHPIMSGMPNTWKHPKDELYGLLRGPAEHMTILATAYNDKRIGGTGRHEPVVMVVNYHKGRVFHTTLGHGEAVYKDKQFMQLLIKGTAWAAGFIGDDININKDGG